MNCTSLVLAWLTLAAPASAPASRLDAAVARLEAAAPRSASDFRAVNLAAIALAAAQVEQTAAAEAETIEVSAPRKVLVTAERLLWAKDVVDRRLESLLALRTQFVALQPTEVQRTSLRNFLGVTAQWIDLSGRLRYLLFDSLNEAAGEVAGQPAQRELLVDLLRRHRSSVGAQVMAVLLGDPPAGSDAARHPPNARLRSKVLDLIAATREYELLPQLAAFVVRPQLSADLAVQAAETIRAVGMPQNARPGEPVGPDAEIPAPSITPAALRSALTRFSGARLDAGLRGRLDALLVWLDDRTKHGITDGHYQLGTADVRPGDWLLMRNPSPYNLFTDLAPGLFTHVGIVTLEQGADGIQRMVLVDLPEWGRRMAGTNIDAFVKRTRHYMILRHNDPATAAKMAAVAAAIIGNETEFDLNFKTERVLALKGQPLAGKKIVTYCAGLLLLCTLETGLPREQFFPVAEYAAGGKTVENLAQLGMVFGHDFISPTGALFSPNLQIVGRRDPMHDPKREVEEAVYNHFASGLISQKLSAAPDLYQSLRLKVATASNKNPLLAQALSKAVGLTDETDLVAAAKAAAVVETLDEIAYANSGQYAAAQKALRSGTIEDLAAEGMNPQQIAEVQQLRARHAQLYQQWEDERISPRALRLALVQFYIQQGRRQIDERFFKAAAPASAPSPTRAAVKAK